MRTSSWYGPRVLACDDRAPARACPVASGWNVSVRSTTRQMVHESTPFRGEVGTAYTRGVRNVAIALAIGGAAAGWGCLMTIDEGRIPCATCDAGLPAPDSATVGAIEAGSLPDASVVCGTSRCPVGADSVCCLSATGPSCSTRSGCLGAKVSCDDTEDCAALGLSGTICCGFDTGLINDASPKLNSTSCVVLSACDPNGPQSQMCNVDGLAAQCRVAGDQRILCSPFAYGNAPTGYASCQ